MKLKQVWLPVLAGALAALIALGAWATEPLTAEYYETVYWGELEKVEKGNVTYYGYPNKTRQVYPEQDHRWVQVENRDGDAINIRMIWDTPGGVGFTYATNKSCVMLDFRTEKDKLEFLHQYELSSWNSVVNMRRLSCEIVYNSLETQIEETKDLIPEGE